MEFQLSSGRGLQSTEILKTRDSETNRKLHCVIGNEYTTENEINTSRYIYIYEEFRCKSL